MKYYRTGYSEYRERRTRAKMGVVGFLVVVAVVFLTSACSHVSRVAEAEQHQVAALAKDKSAGLKVENDTKRQLAEIANLATQTRMILQAPETNQTNPVLTALANRTLTLAGAPSDDTARLQAEVASLMAGGEKQEQELARKDKVIADMQKQHTADVAARQKADANVVSMSTRLYQEAIVGAQSADDSISTLRWIFWGIVGVGVFVLLWAGLRIAEHLSQATATAAAKAP